MKKSVLLPIAQGSEDMETVIILDILRRADLDVILAGESEMIICARGLKILPDVLLDNIDNEEIFNAVVLPGGIGGVDKFLKNEHLRNIVINNNKAGSMICAVCAAPTLLLAWDLLKKGQKVTSHPSFADKFVEMEYCEDNVVFGEHQIMSRGAGTCISFALSIVENLSGIELANKIAKDIVYK